MKRQLSISLLLLLMGINNINAQGYSPTKETVPNINRYQAFLLLDQNLAAITEGNYWKLQDIDNFRYSYTYLIHDSDIVLNVKMTPESVDAIPAKLLFSNISSLIVERSKHAGDYRLKFDVNASRRNSYRFYNDDEAILKKIADALFIIQSYDQFSADKKELETFSPIAQRYSSLIEKPALNEESRKFLVQASTATEDKRYMDGIELLAKASAIDPTYPQAHFNLALLWAQLSIYGAAVVEMKKYLMLAPNAEDARAAQDKIYEWEGKSHK